MVTLASLIVTDFLLRGADAFFSTTPAACGAWPIVRFLRTTPPVMFLAEGTGLSLSPPMPMLGCLALHRREGRAAPLIGPTTVVGAKVPSMEIAKELVAAYSQEREGRAAALLARADREMQAPDRTEVAGPFRRRRRNRSKY